MVSCLPWGRDGNRGKKKGTEGDLSFQPAPWGSRRGHLLPAPMGLCCLELRSRLPHGVALEPPVSRLGGWLPRCRDSGRHSHRMPGHKDLCARGSPPGQNSRRIPWRITSLISWKFRNQNQVDNGRGGKPEFRFRLKESLFP